MIGINFCVGVVWLAFLCGWGAVGILYGRDWSVVGILCGRHFCVVVVWLEFCVIGISVWV